MDSPDESRGETNEHASTSSGSTPEVQAPGTAAGGTGAISPARPRSSAKFAGGAPPATTSAPPTPAPAPSPAPAQVPSFQVTTVDRSTASRPAGPPPAKPKASATRATPAPETPAAPAARGRAGATAATAPAESAPTPP